MKIDPYKYPIVIITAFVIGMLLAFALGFRPKHGSIDLNGHEQVPAALVQTVPLWEFSIT